MNRILFVDDEPNVLEGLQRLLRPQRREWEMYFASGGEQALSVLAERPFDVVVTDIRMPGMDGTALLEKVRQQYPQMGRVVLSGQTEIKLALRTVSLAHQFLPKPCDVDVLRLAIERTCSLQRALSSETLARVIGSMGDLPAAPRVHTALLQALSDSRSSLEQIGAIVGQDVALSAKVLQLVNSAFFGLSRDITSVRDAVSYLGVEILQSVVASVEVVEVFDGVQDRRGFSIDEFQDHAQLTARIASSFPLPRSLCDAAAAGGLLHDVGKLVLATRLPECLDEAVRIASERRQPLHEIEVALYGVSHAEVGAYLLGLWGLPTFVTEAVAHHHQPMRAPHRELNPVTVVYLSDLLAHEFDHSPWSFRAPQPVLEELGVAESFPAFQECARQVVSELLCGSYA